MSKKYFDLPATVGIQGGVRQFCVTVQLRVLKHILQCDDSGSTMQRSQRAVNHVRRSRIAAYVNDSIKAGKPYILPTLSGNLEQVDFRPFDGQPNCGILRINKGANIKLFDGQHRSSSTSFIYDIDQCEDTITLLLTENIDLFTRQQFFSDINFNAVKPSAAQNKAYDKRDPRGLLAQYVADRTSLNSMLCIEYEKNTVTGGNQRLYSFKALYDCLVKMFKLTDKSEVTDQMKEDAVSLVSAWNSKLLWSAIAGFQAPAYRQSYLGTHAIMILAIGAATRHLLDTRSVEEAVEVIKESELHYKNSFGYVDFEHRCVDSETWKIRCDARALKLTTSLLLQHLEVILPDDLKALETEVFGTTEFLGSEESKEYIFHSDKSVEAPGSKDDWLALLQTHLSSYLPALFITDVGCEMVAMAMEKLERKIVFTRPKEELVKHWAEIAEISPKELEWLRFDANRRESEVKKFMQTRTE
ncbi:TPA: DGQHR domain-containing protein [Salmonella enterica subsp. salamae serovar 35:g,m,s,t:-]|nr:DGQHR domain-containing protein [Salmonella enterica subsp. salamae serovar 35:g,m,s,t:-]HCA3549714.1 DGQHR domain-containing protein [Salmonella enterica subsp. salamae serovar 35:g,m,s,t:-]